MSEALARVERFTFDGDPLEVVRGEGEAHVVIRRVCEALGVAYQAQIRRLRSDPSVGVIMMITPSAGGPQRTACLDLRSLPLWLAGIHPSKVKASVRPKLVRYKRKCAEVLADHFLGKRSGATIARVQALDEGALAVDGVRALIARQLEPLQRKVDALDKLVMVMIAFLPTRAGGPPAARLPRRAAPAPRTLGRPRTSPQLLAVALARVDAGQKPAKVAADLREAGQPVSEKTIRRALAERRLSR